jgi:Gram-negative bacterial TonB protein C-terminal
MKNLIVISIIFLSNCVLLFAQKYDEKIDTLSQFKANNGVVINFLVDSSAHFPGGANERSKFLGQNLRYPFEAQINNIIGKIYISFIVLASGEITNILVSEKSNKHLAMEGIRLIKAMPKWIPAYYNGNAVNTQYTFPISFNNLGFGKSQKN